MSKHLLAYSISIDLCIVDTLIVVKCHLVMSVEKQRWEYGFAIEVLDYDVERFAVPLGVEDHHAEVVLLAYLEIVERLMGHLLNEYFDTLDEFFDAVVLDCIFSVEVNKVAKLENHLLREFFLKGFMLLYGVFVIRVGSPQVRRFFESKAVPLQFFYWKPVKGHAVGWVGEPSVVYVFSYLDWDGIVHDLLVVLVLS